MLPGQEPTKNLLGGQDRSKRIDAKFRGGAGQKEVSAVRWKAGGMHGRARERLLSFASWLSWELSCGSSWRLAIGNPTAVEPGGLFMIGKFVTKSDVRREKLFWGELAWYSSPRDGGLKQLVVIEVTLSPRRGHAFHCHPTQEEVIYCLKGEVEQWLGEEKAILREGDAVVIPAGGVHASFNRSDKEAVLLAIIGPAASTESGYSVEELADKEPWRSLLAQETGSD